MEDTQTVKKPMLVNKYQINLIRSLRKEEKASDRRRTFGLAFSVSCFGILILLLFYSVLQVLRMEETIQSEADKLSRLQAEYRKYEQTRMIVNKADLELLDSLQNTRIFWTKKLASMALHLPENYWITSFGYKPVTYFSSGYGYISPKQEQLVTIDDYLNALRADSTYNDVFKNTFFKSTTRSDEGYRSRVTFEYQSLR